MLLLVDAGNSRLKCVFAKRTGDGWQLLDDLELVSHAQISDKLNHIAQRNHLNAVLVSSVAGAQVNQQIESALQAPVLFAKVSDQCGDLINQYQSKNTLGVDRWVAAIGAVEQAKGYHNQPTSLIVVDAGTAVTVDVIADSVHYIGGVILPGARLMHESLVGNTAGIRARYVDVKAPIGKTTEQCVNAGVKFGLAGAVQKVIEEIMADLGVTKRWQIYLCGGDADWLAQLINVAAPVKIEPDLIFQGLVSVYENNQFGELDV